MVIIVLLLLLWNPWVSVKTVPTGAQIIFDNNAISGSARTKPGSHQLIVKLNGYVDFNEDINLRPLSIFRKTIELKPIPEAKPLVDDSVFALSATDSESQFYFLSQSDKTIFQMITKPTDNKGRDKNSVVAENRIVSKRAITPGTLPAIDRVIFSPDFSLAIFKLKNGETGLYDFKRYNLVNQEYHPWNSNIGDIIWRPDGQKLIYYLEGTDGSKTLVQTPVDHQAEENVFDLRDVGIEKPQLAWSPSGELIALVSGGNLYTINYPVNADRPLTKLVEGGVQNVRFSPDSDRLIYAQNNSLKTVSIKKVDAFDPSEVDNVGYFRAGEPVDLGITATSANTAFSPDHQSIVVADTNSKIYLVDLKANKTKEIFYKTDSLVQIKNIGLSADGKVLYFLTGNDQLMFLKLETSGFKEGDGGRK